MIGRIRSRLQCQTARLVLRWFYAVFIGNDLTVLDLQSHESPGIGSNRSTEREVSTDTVFVIAPFLFALIVNSI